MRTQPKMSKTSQEELAVQERRRKYREQKAKWMETNRERRKAQKNANYRANAKRYCQYHTAWRNRKKQERANGIGVISPEDAQRIHKKKLEAQRRWLEKHRSEHNYQRRKEYAANPEKILNYHTKWRMETKQEQRKNTISFISNMDKYDSIMETLTAVLNARKNNITL